MGPFSRIVVSPYPDGVTWWLAQPLRYCALEVPRGFETDFASVPALFTNVLPRWSDYGAAAILHDWLYWSQTCARAAADRTFLEAMTRLGVASWKGRTLWAAVRLFGWIAWRDNARIALEGFSRIHGNGSPARPAWKRRKWKAVLHGQDAGRLPTNGPAK